MFVHCLIPRVLLSECAGTLPWSERNPGKCSARVAGVDSSNFRLPVLHTIASIDSFHTDGYTGAPFCCWRQYVNPYTRLVSRQTLLITFFNPRPPFYPFHCVECNPSITMSFNEHSAAAAFECLTISLFILRLLIRERLSRRRELSKLVPNHILSYPYIVIHLAIVHLKR